MATKSVVDGVVEFVAFGTAGSQEWHTFLSSFVHMRLLSPHPEHVSGLQPTTTVLC